MNAVLKWLAAVIAGLLAAVTVMFLGTRGDYPVAGLVTEDPSLLSVTLDGVALNPRVVDGPARRLNTKAPRILHHDGGTAGSTRAIYVCPERAQAHAVLANNGVAASLWASGKLSWSNRMKQAYEHFTAT